ncbi:MAG TPA: sugar ABC transporter ATP-binding protein [Opitutus sp.]|nr:sugar ABC transporter ATP-binding protein [Opitutus sp.]
MSSTIAPLLAFRNIRKSFGAVRALRGVDFDVNAGEVHALLGENGAGKSTLIKVATGAHAPDDGAIVVGGESVPRLNPTEARRRGIACIYQQPALFPDLTVEENIGLRLEGARRWQGVNWRERRTRAVELLGKVGADIAPDREVRTLSMPEQQLIEIACALGAGARVMIMDEPTASLTRREQERLYGIVRDLRSAGVAVIYISHRLEEIFALADRVTVLRDGESVGTHRVSDIDETKLIRLMVGREIAVLYPSRSGQPETAGGADPAGEKAEQATTGSAKGAPALELRGVGCATAGVRAVSFAVAAGEIFGMAGIVGAGRTELARVVFGLTPADDGQIVVAGNNVAIRSPRDAMNLGIGYVPEDRRRHGVVLELPIEHNVTLAIHPQIFPGGWLHFGEERRTARDFIERLGIKASGPDAPAGSLSGGNQQKVALARWLATRPKVLILDEPTQGVDVGAKSEIHRIIRQLADAGLAVILISSDLPEVIGMSDRIGVMREGRLIRVLERGSSAEAVMAAALGKPEGHSR